MVEPRQRQQHYQCSFLVRYFLNWKFYRLNDPSVLNDFLGETYAKNQKLDTLSMENVSATLQHCLSLVNSKYEAHSITCIKASGNIFNVFRDVMLSLLNNFIEDHVSQDWCCQWEVCWLGERKTHVKIWRSHWPIRKTDSCAWMGSRNEIDELAVARISEPGWQWHRLLHREM